MVAMQRQMARRPGRWRLVHEMRARDVIARIEAVEVAAHLRKLVGAIRCEGLGGLVGGARCALTLEKIFDRGACRQRARAFSYTSHEVSVVFAEYRVDQPELAR